jgi:hypothetical protein
LKPSARNVVTKNAPWLTPMSARRRAVARSARAKSRTITSPTPCAVAGTEAAMPVCHCTRA